MVEAENAMKWTATEPSQGHFDFAPGDQIAAFAQAHGMKVRGHNLLWGKHNPAWLTSGHFTAPQLAKILQTHIQTVARHYAGKVFAWDVVNEAFDEQGHLSHTLWYDQPGIGLAGQGTKYIEQAFRWAHEADPHALLFYNDFNVASINAKSTAMYEMVRDFRRRGVPIDGVGLQLHHSNLDPESLATLKANLARFAALGLQIHITEMDVALPMDAQRQLLHPEDLQRQAAIYREVAAACAAQPACTAFQTWGFTDRYSWIPGYTHGKKGHALIFDAHYQPKPAYRALVQALKTSTPAVDSQRRQDCRCGE
jgi:endo-1,4-beta-xylanase